MNQTQNPAETARAGAIPRPVLLLLLIGIGLNIRAVLGAVPVLNDPITAELGMSAAGFSLITSLTMFTMAFCAPLGHALATRISYQWAIFWLLVVLGLGGTLRLFVDSTWTIYATSVLCGVGMGGASALAPGFISHTLHKIRGTATGIFSLAMAMGVAASAGAAAPVAELAGWRSALALWGLTALVVAVFWVMLIPRLRRIPHPVVESAAPAAAVAESPTGENASVTEHEATGGHEAEQPIRRGLPLRDATAWLVTIISTLILLAGFTGVAWIAPAMQDAGHSPAHSAVLFSGFQLVQTISLIGLPVITDFTKDRRPLLALCALTASAGIVILLIDPMTLAWPGCLLMGFGVGGGSTLTLILIQDVTTTTNDAGRLSAMSLFSSYFLGALGPLAIGVARDLTGGFTAGFLILLGVTLLTLVLVPFLHPRRRLRT